MVRDNFFIALSNLKHRGVRSWLTVLGVFIGIAAVVSLISLGDGLRTAIISQFGTLATDRLTIQNAGTGFGPPGSTSVRKLNERDIKIVESVPGIDVVISRLIRVVKLEYNNGVSFSYVASIPEEEKQANFIYDSQGIKVLSGRLLKPGESGKIVLGNNFYDSKTNGFGKKIEVGSNVILQGKKYEVVGILEKSSSFIVNSAIQISEKDLRDLLKIPEGETDVIVVKVSDKDRVEDVAKSIAEKLRRDRNQKIGEEDFTIQTPLQALNTVNTILSIVNLVVVSIALISLLIGAIGIANTMYTAVLERTREIGVMKAIGAQNKDVLSIFMIESGLIGLTGGIAGSLIGLAMAFGVSTAANSYFGIQILKVSISYSLIFSAIIFSFVLGIFSGIFPAIQASKLKPVEALRK